MRDGREVAFVGVIDTWPSEAFPRDFVYVCNWIANLPKWFRVDFRTTDEKANMDRLRRAGRILRRKLRQMWSPSSEAHQRRLDDHMRVPDHLRVAGDVNLRAFLSYQPGPYDGSITLFRAYAQPLISSHSADLGWSSFAKSVTVVPVPGNHGSQMTMPDVAVLARQLQAALAAARAQPRR